MRHDRAPITWAKLPEIVISTAQRKLTQDHGRPRPQAAQARKPEGSMQIYQHGSPSLVTARIMVDRNTWWSYALTIDFLF
ncbi:hypothetical protein Csal_0734 [Chromohalobacter israelensis DSM 3043]|uniref:Uncharacterized protein n=1 Tax=Chromohalobacter israelensis (strain ATCC BAA-138 / DSM 3043 / CIP 106854 / NCIMB 13768 / 1H11) TaxID=290398 RepID=Q1QZL3_CHRI1|nr:hypothetical protein Csal_0734 [Chromohalobacter salexigens DSM 3043]